MAISKQIKPEKLQGQLGWPNCPDPQPGPEYVPYDGGDIFMEYIACTDLNGQKYVDTSCPVRTNVKHKIVRHSPAGLNFGYGGSGPADMALNILAMFCKYQSDADLFYQEFKRQFLVVPKATRLVIPRQFVIDFLTQRGVQVK